VELQVVEVVAVAVGKMAFVFLFVYKYIKAGSCENLMSFGFICSLLTLSLSFSVCVCV
jgi:hypothetical protein